MKLNNLGQLIKKYPKLKEISISMAECLDFERVDDNFDLSPYILVDGEKLVKKFLSKLKKSPLKCTFNNKTVTFAINSMFLVIVDEYNNQTYKEEITDYPNILNTAMVYYCSGFNYADVRIEDCIVSEELYDNIEKWVSELEPRKEK